MEQYIKKSALVAEIERLKESFVNERDGFEKGYHHGLDMVLSFLDTLETKEVNSEKAYKWLKENKDHPFIGCEDYCLSGFLTDDFIEEFHKAMEE